MSLLFRRAPQQRLFGVSDPSQLVPPRSASSVGQAAPVTNETAMRHSAVWACVRLRADLISTMPVDSYRDINGIDVEVPNAPVLVNPGGERVGIQEWLYSSQVDLDRGGNVFGLITERTSEGKPLRIDLQPLSTCSVIQRGPTMAYRIGGKEYDPSQVWHERQYTVSGLPVGLSPIAYAAYSIGQYQSAQAFALTWYGTGGVPKGHLQNTALPVVTAADADIAKERFKAGTTGGDVLVTGKDWEYKPFQAEAMGNDWLEAQKFGIGDVARFMGCPGDLIDAAITTGNITYANVTQRNMQFLTMHLGPAIARRETALSSLLPRGRFVKLNTSMLLRMDDETRARVIKTQIESRTRAPSEAREKDNLEPFTPEQLAEFDRLFGPPRSATPTPTPVPAVTP